MHPFAPLSLVLAASLWWSATPLSAAIDPGERLLGELNCIACHTAGSEVTTRLAPHQAPRLGDAGVQITPQHLHAYLENSSATKPGTTMPDMLHGLDPAARAEAADALTHYLISLQEPDRKPPAAANSAIIETGRKLYHSVGCVACHAPQELPESAAQQPEATAQLTQLQQASTPLGPLAQKYSLGELSALLKNPLKARPSGRMPSLKLSDAEARAIAMYLLREQATNGTTTRLPGLTYEYYEQSLPELPEFDRLDPQTTGTTNEFSLAVAKRKADIALRFRGLLNVEKEGSYVFYLSCDDGGRLYVDDELVVDNGGIHSSQERNGKVKLTAGEHRLTVGYFNAAGEAELKVEWKAPDVKRQPIPAQLLSHEGAPMLPLGAAPFTVDAAKAERGRSFFTSLQCASCHVVQLGSNPGSMAVFAAQALGELSGKMPSGCLAPQPPAKAAKFNLSEPQRTALLATLQNQATLGTPLTASEQVEHTMTALNCSACHQRGENNGPEGLRREYFTSAEKVDLGDEGRIPPHLNGLGAKLKPGWVTAVLTKGAAVRPYLATRMPQFGDANVRALPAAFTEADAALAGPDPKFPTGETAHDAEKMGRRLVGVGGLTCIACHTFAGHASLGAPALDLTTVTTRLQPDWFRRYLIDPQALRPGTRMPSFWPGGVAANTSLLNGDTGQQIAAIWAYLARGKDTDLPDGLLRARLELVAENEAVIYRNFIGGSGPRAIGVGYPEKANLAFDADEMRIAEIWQGSFMDMGRHHTGRGEGFEPPLGVNVLKGPTGPPFAVLADTSAAWPKDTGKPAGYQFHGYRLDDRQRPTFRYSFQGVNIEDFPQALPGDPDGTFRRTVTLHNTTDAPGRLFFRAAVGQKIEQENEAQPAEPKMSVFTVDGKTKLKFSGAQPIVRAGVNGFELLVPIDFTGPEARFVEEISW